MSPLEIVIPLIWAGGLIGLVALFAGRGGNFPLEYFFPAAGALGLLIFILGLLDLWSRTLFVVFTIALAVTFIYALVKTPLPRRFAGFVRAHPFFFAAFTVASTWFGLAAVSYPVGTDALYFHLGLPKLYARAGDIFFTPGILFSAGPRAMEMITTAFYFLGLERGAQLFIVFIAAALMVAVYLRAVDFGAHGIFAILVFASVPVVVAQLTGSKNDYLLWGISFFACLKFLEFLRQGRASALLWSAVGAGLAAGTKAIGLGLLGALIIVLLYEVTLGKSTIRHLINFIIVAAATLSPWYLYSWAVTGNPVFPFFDNIFHSPFTTSVFENFNAALAVERVSPKLVNLIVSPILLIFDPESYDGRLGYALLLFPALLIFIPRIPIAVKRALGVAAAFYIVWFFGFAFARFLLPVGPLLAIAGAFFIARADETSRLPKWGAVASLALAVLLPIPGVLRDTTPRALGVLHATPKYEFLRGFRALDPYRTQSAEPVAALPYIDCWRFINENTSPGSRIGILTSFVTRADGYYLERDFVYLNPSEQVQYDFASLRDRGEVAEILRQLGVTHVVLDSAVAAQYSPGSDWSTILGFEALSTGVSALCAYLRDDAVMLYGDGRFTLYGLSTE